MRKTSTVSFLVLVIAFAVTACLSVNAQGMSDNVIPGQFIVVLNDAVADPAATAQGIVEQHGLILGHVFSVALKGFSAQIPTQKLGAVKADPRVNFIEPDVTVHAIAPPPNQGGKEAQPLQVIPTGIDRIDAEQSLTARIDGVDQRVDADIAIIDTGVSARHPDLNFFTGITVAGAGKPGGDDDNGHGSHVAGIAAAIDNNIGIVGVAPGARLWSVKALDKFGSGSLSGVIAGIDWITAPERATQIEVANMSLGFEGRSVAFDTAITNSIAVGIVYVVAAGNSVKDASTFSPANHPDVITVSAITDTDGKSGGAGRGSSFGGADRNGDGVDDGKDDTFAWFSNFGVNVDLAAPGVDILSTWKGDAYNTISGTSMASPHVGGAAALYIIKSIFGKPTNSAGVAIVRQDLINGGAPQSGIKGFTGDPDASPEPLVDAEKL